MRFKPPSFFHHGILTFCTFFISILIGCQEPSKNPIQNQNTAYLDTIPIGIYGSWNWVKSQGGIGGIVKTPESEGYTEKIVFRTDSSFEMYQDNFLLYNTQYYLSWEFTLFRSDSVEVLHYQDESIGKKNQMIVRLGKDSWRSTTHVSIVSAIGTCEINNRGRSLQ